MDFNWKQFALNLALAIAVEQLVFGSVSRAFSNLMKRKASADLMPAKRRKKAPRKQNNNISKLTFLGTSSAVPTTRRNMSAMCMTLADGSGILVDCGEATQHQFLRSRMKPAHVKCICITHLHGDHCYGLFGLLHTLSAHTADAEDKEMLIIGPRGIRQLIETVFKLTGGFPFRHVMEIIELDHTGAEFVTDFHGIRISAAPLQHRMPTYGYIFEEPEKPGSLDGKKAAKLGARGKQMGTLKAGGDVTLDDGRVIKSADVLGAPTPGRKVCVLWDTMDSSKAQVLCQDADLLIHEATYDNSVHAKALAYGHSTALMAGQFAADVGAKMLILTHFSPRYEKGFPVEDGEKEMNMDDLRIEAESVSKCPVFCANDYSVYESVSKGGFRFNPEIDIKNEEYREFVLKLREQDLDLTD